MKKFVPFLGLAVVLALINLFVTMRLNRNVVINAPASELAYRAGPGFEYRPVTSADKGVALGASFDGEWVLISMILEIGDAAQYDRKSFAWVPARYIEGNLDDLPVINNDMRLVNPYAQITCWASGTTQSNVLGLTIRRGNDQEISFSHPTLKEEENETWGVYEFEIATLPEDGLTVYLNGNVLAQIRYDPDNLNVLFDSCTPGD